MKHRPAWNLADVTQCTVSSDTLVGYTGPTAKPQCQIMLKKLTFSKHTAGTSSAMSDSEGTWCPLSL